MEQILTGKTTLISQLFPGQKEKGIQRLLLFCNNNLTIEILSYQEKKQTQSTRPLPGSRQPFVCHVCPLTSKGGYPILIVASLATVGDICNMHHRQNTLLQELIIHNSGPYKVCTPMSLWWLPTFFLFSLLPTRCYADRLNLGLLKTQWEFSLTILGEIPYN